MVGIPFTTWCEMTEDEREGIMVSILDGTEEHNILSEIAVENLEKFFKKKLVKIQQISFYEKVYVAIPTPFIHTHLSHSGLPIRTGFAIGSVAFMICMTPFGPATTFCIG